MSDLARDPHEVGRTIPTVPAGSVLDAPSLGTPVVSATAPFTATVPLSPPTKGGPFGNYQVTVTPSAGVTVDPSPLPAAATQLMLGGLAPGGVYTVSVAGTNRYGVGPADTVTFTVAGVDNTDPTLVHYFSFDGWVSSATVNDDSIYGNPGTAYNFGDPPETETGANGAGRAATFRVAQLRRIEIPDFPGLDLTTGLTLAARVRFNANIGGNNANDPRWELSEKAGAFWWNIRNDVFNADGTNRYVIRFAGFFGGSFPPKGTTDSVGVVPSDGAFHDLAVTYNGSRIRYYIDGAPAGSVPMSGALTVNNEPLVIGAKHSYSLNITPEAFFSGGMDEHRVYNRALSAAEIAALAGASSGGGGGSPAGTVARYDFNTGEVTASAVADSSGQNNTAVPVGFGGAAPATAAGPVSGGRAMLFNRANSQYLRVPDAPSLALNTFTLAAWVKPTLGVTPDDRWTVLDKGGSYALSIRSGQGSGTATEAGKVRGAVFAGGSTAADWKHLESVASLAPNRWQPIVVTYDGATLKVYINGALDSSMPVAGATFGNTQWLGVGVHQQSAPNTPEGPLGYFDGQIAAARVANYAWSAADVALYSATSTGGGGTGGSSLIQVADFNYSAGTPVRTLQEAKDAAAAYDVILGKSSKYTAAVITAMRQINPSLEMWDYYNGVMDDTGVADLICRNANGTYRLVSGNVQFNNYAQDPTAAAWKTAKGNDAQAAAAAGFDSGFNDIFGPVVFSGFLNTAPAGQQPNTPAGAGFTWATWSAAIRALAAYQRNAAGGRLTITGNYIDNGKKWFAASESSDDITPGVDGGLAEAWLRTARNTGATEFRTEADWKLDVDVLADMLKRYPGKKFVVSCKLWPAGGTTAAQQLQWARYSLCTYLLGAGDTAGNNNAYYCFNLAEGQNMDPTVWPYAYDWKVNVGTPIEAYSKVGGVYKRTFTGGLVLVNPNGTAATFQVTGGPYKGLPTAAGGAEPTVANGTITVPAHTGMILRSTTVAQAPIAAPTGLTATPVTGSSTVEHLTWTPVSDPSPTDPVTGYEVLESSTVVASVGPGVFAADITGAAGSTHTVKVRARAGTRVGPASDPVTYTLPAPPTSGGITAVGANTQVASGSGTSTSYVVPNGVVDGDLLTWIVTASTNAPLTVPNVWTQVAAVPTGPASQLTVFQKWAAGDAPGSTFTASISSGLGKFVSLCLADRGVDPTTPLDTTPTTSTNNTPPAITTVTANAKVIVAGRGTSASGVTNTAYSSASGTMRTQGTQTSATAGNATAGAAEQTQTTPGAVTPALAATGDPLTGAMRLVLALRPATGGTVGALNPPGNFTATAGTAGAETFAWDRPADPGGGETITGYQLILGSGVVKTITNPATLSATLTGLAAGTYTAAVKATTSAGRISAASNTQTFTVGGSSGAALVVYAAGDLSDSSNGDTLASDIVVAAADKNMMVTMGDNAYGDGLPAEFSSLYEPTWGRVKGITYPVPGNHDYRTYSDARGFRGYFGAVTGQQNAIQMQRIANGPPYYYAFTRNNWLFIALDSTLDPATGLATGFNTTQLNWLDGVLADGKVQGVKGIIAWWHHPRYSSGTDHGSETGQSFKDVWAKLYAAKADIVLVGHEHNYERFAKQDGLGNAKPDGIRQFLVGTGGSGGTYPFGTPLANSEKRIGSTEYGVLKLKLTDTDYTYQWLPSAGSVGSDGPTTVAVNPKGSGTGGGGTGGGTGGTSSPWDVHDTSIPAAATGRFFLAGTLYGDPQGQDDASRNITVTAAQSVRCTRPFGANGAPNETVTQFGNAGIAAGGTATYTVSSTGQDRCTVTGVALDVPGLSLPPMLVGATGPQVRAFLAALMQGEGNANGMVMDDPDPAHLQPIKDLMATSAAYTVPTTIDNPGGSFHRLWTGTSPSQTSAADLATYAPRIQAYPFAVYGRCPGGLPAGGATGNPPGGTRV